MLTDSLNSLLTNRLSYLLKIINDFLIVFLVVDVKLVPQVASYHHTSETKVFGYAHVVERHASHRIHLLVYKPFVGSLFELLHGEI